MTTRPDDVPPIKDRLAVLEVAPPAAAFEDVANNNRTLRILLIVAAIALTLVIAVGAALILSNTQARERSNRNAEAASQAKEAANQAAGQAQAAQSAANEANRRLKEAGKPTVTIPTVTVSPTFYPPPEGLTEDQASAVSGMIATELLRFQPRLSPTQVQQVAQVAAGMVPKPKDGRTPSATELRTLAAAVHAQFCANGRCDGKPGTTGPAGPSGAPGQPGEDGADAPPLTTEQIQGAVSAGLAAYCSQPSEPCRSSQPGPTGPSGPPGKDAPPPYSIEDIDCQGSGSDSYWLIYISNGSTQFTKEVKGPCRLALLPSAVLSKSKK